MMHCICSGYVPTVHHVEVLSESESAGHELVLEVSLSVSGEVPHGQKPQNQLESK